MKIRVEQHDAFYEIQLYLDGMTFDGYIFTLDENWETALSKVVSRATNRNLKIVIETHQHGRITGRLVEALV